MEADENHHKRSRVDDDGEKKGTHPWHHPSSRIFRVSRASGGKDRHSKVYTAKGLRDRRVRLSVSTAIQFYDLQDRLGYDQPSKAIEWLIKSAATAIAELPTLESSFPELPGHELVEHSHQQQHLSVSRSGCSSTSETSKGSVLSLSRSESRVKARERARERAAKEKEVDDVSALQHQSLNSDQGSFTELLTGSSSNGANCIQKGINYMPVTTTADYFAQARIFGQAQKAQRPPSSDFASQAHLGDTSHVGVLPFNIAAAAAAAGEHTEMRQFPFLQNHPVVPIAAIGPGDYTLNFSISPGHLHRGPLQSNSPSQLPHHHLPRLSPSVDGSNMPFFFGAASPATASATSAENQFTAGFDGRLQLCYGDEYRHSDLKGKGKS